MSHDPLTELNAFLAYSLSLEEDSVERLEEMADMMAVHHQGDIERLFRQLAEYSKKHADDVLAICGNTELPVLKPWDFIWPGAEPPETCAYASAAYGMTTRQALTNMLMLERNTAEFYQEIAERSPNEDIAKLAQEFANEEISHASAIEEWLQRIPDGENSYPDMDPPTEPDS